MRAGIGLEPGKVRLVAYDPRWPALFETEAALIRGALGASVMALEHMGSTAVVGLAAKPVIDVLLAIASLRGPRGVYTALERIGYDHRPLDPLGDRLFFAKDSELGRTHNLSVCAADSAFWIAHVRFRDRLRADARLASDYASLKRALAVAFANDRVGYTDAKDAFIARALAGTGRTMRAKRTAR